METELLTPVSLTDDRGLLNTDSVGWARTPVVNTDGIGGARSSRRQGGGGGDGGFRRKAWGRNKRWEYWNVMTPTHILAITVSDLDYACVNEVWVLNRGSEVPVGKAAVRIPARGVKLPGTLNEGKVRAQGGGVEIAIDSMPGGTRLRARLNDPEQGRLRFDVFAEKPADHDALAVVVPWSKRRFQYTVKDVARPARGWVQVGSHSYEVPAGESWAVLDHGRGRWPYNMTWNWGSGSGVAAGVTYGVQVGGKWTDGTGSTENSISIDGHIHKISEELTWEYDLENIERPWRIHGGGLEAAFTPFYNKRGRMNFGILANSTDQCFGVWDGSFTSADGAIHHFTGIEGFAEHVHNRW